MIAFFLGGWGGGSSMQGFIEEKSPDFRFQEVGISVNINTDDNKFL